MKKKEIYEFETLQGQFQAFHTEMNTLVKKNPNDALNKFKLGLVNSVLKKANTILGKERQPFAEFESFDEATMPSTSDVLLIISQYISAFEKLRAENIYWDYDENRWCWRGGEKIPTGPPKKLEK
ncbi:MAG TPA: hypothetical protein VEQ38_21095 [Verrucomicrobiae bacterium]|nr:hypothetical protein [Verrucomicrobiae bacterium]